MNYGTITSYVSSAALAPKPTLRQRLVILVKSSRPPGWTFGPILYGIGAIHSAIIPKTLGALAISATQIAALGFPLCIVVFGINDIYDYASDLLNPRKSATSLEGAILPPPHHPFVRRAAIISTGIVLATSMLPTFYDSSVVSLGTSWQSCSPVMSTTALLALGWMYSAPPARLKEVPVVDSISNGLIVWLSWFIGFSSCRVLAGQSGLQWGLADIPSKGYVIGLVTASVHALGAAADIEADVAAGQRTIATVLGRRGCTLLGATAYLIALTIEDPMSIFGVYLIGGLGIMLSACVFPSQTWVHRAFQAVVSWTVLSAGVWFVVRISERLNA